MNWLQVCGVRYFIFRGLFVIKLEQLSMYICTVDSFMF